MTYNRTKVSNIILLLVRNKARYWFTAVESDTVFYSYDCYKLPDWLFPRSYSFSRQRSKSFSVLSCDLFSLEHVNAMKHLETTSAVNKIFFAYIKSLWT